MYKTLNISTTRIHNTNASEKKHTHGNHDPFIKQQTECVENDTAVDPRAYRYKKAYVDSREFEQSIQKATQKPMQKTTQHSKQKKQLTVIEKAIDTCIEAAKKNVTEGHRPFAAVLVPSDSQEELYKSQGITPLVCSVDRVEQDCDPCAHAEIIAIRKACKKLRRTVLHGFTMVCTTFPCPMCLSAMDWARVDGFYYCTPLTGVRIRDQEQMYKTVCDRSYRNVHLHMYQAVTDYIYLKWEESLV